MSVVITYALAAFPNGKVNAAGLSDEIKANGAIAKSIEAVASDRESCSVSFAADVELTTDEKIALDSVVAAHNEIRTRIKFHAVSTMVVSEEPVVALVDWQMLGKVRANPSFFTADLGNAVGRLVGEVKTTGSGLQLRIVEVSGGIDVDMTPTPFRAPDSAGVWAPIKFMTQVPPRAGDNTYRLDGKIDALTIASVDACALALLEIVKS